MSLSTCLLYLVGHGPSIERVARSRGAFWTGIGLVLLTAIARSYDQTFIGEKPLLMLGPLGFSLVSGTWLYFWAYAIYARHWMRGPDPPRPPVWQAWPSFMGLFWMTAPIAWLYALPVERILDPLAAARANIALLAVVSLWRVLLMTRVLQHLTRCPWPCALLWILIPASMEVMVVFMVSGQFAASVMRAMSGLRHSPEEGVLLSAMDDVLFGAFLTLPAALVASFLLKPRHPLTPWPARQPDRPPWKLLAVATAAWITIAIPAQLEVWRTWTVERLMLAGRHREALDFAAARQPHDFAPARPLPPKPYEREVFTGVPASWRALRPDDPPWVRSWLVSRMDTLFAHCSTGMFGSYHLVGDQKLVEFRLPQHVGWNLTPETLLALVNDLDRIPEGRSWLRDNPRFLQSLMASAEEPGRRRGDTLDYLFESQPAWNALAERAAAVQAQLRPPSERPVGPN